MTCTDLVIQDHIALRRALDILDGMINKLERGDRIEIADAVEILKFLRLFGMEYYQTIEEKVLFAALTRAVPEENRIQHMVFEHSEQRSLVAAVENAITVRKGIDFVRNSRGLIVLLRNHYDREDAVLRSTTLSKGEDDALSGEIVNSRKAPEAYVNLESLEYKYTSKKPYLSLTADRANYAKWKTARST